MDHFTLALMTGAVAGALDIIPMIAQKLSFRSCLSAFLQYFFAGPIVFYSNLPYLPWWADGMAVTLMMALPVVLILTGKDRKAAPSSCSMPCCWDSSSASQNDIWHKMKNFKGIIYAALSSSTFGLAPLFSILLLSDGFSSFEVLSYRWGVASLTLGIIGLADGCRFRISRQELCTVFFLSLFRAATSLSLVIAYQNISSGVASIIHFMYPLAVALAMALFFRERISWRTAAAIGVSLAGVALLSAGGIGSRGGDTTSGTVAAAVSVFAYAGYIIGVRKSRAAQVESTTLTFYVMAFGALLFLCGGMFTGGVRLVTDGKEWLAILGLALPATAISNITLVRAIKFIGPTLTSIFGALEPLTAVAIGATVFGERFGWTSALGVGLVVAAVSIVVLDTQRKTGKTTPSSST